MLCSYLGSPHLGAVSLPRSSSLEIFSSRAVSGSHEELRCFRDALCLAGSASPTLRARCAIPIAISRLVPKQLLVRVRNPPHLGRSKSGRYT